MAFSFATQRGDHLTDRSGDGEASSSCEPANPPHPAPRNRRARTPGPDDPLRIAYLTYRGKPHVGGQGVYTRHLTKALVDLGHHVEVLSGQPYPLVDDRVPLVELPSLDIYNDHFPMRMPGIWELKDRWDFAEVTAFSSGTFPEPLAFSLRAWDHLRRRRNEFDLVHDNQCLGYGLLLMERDGLPVLGTIHHPITVDRRLEMEHAEIALPALVQGALVRLHQDADPGGQAPAPRHHGVAELLRRHLPGPPGLARATAHRARGRRPGAVHAPARRRRATPTRSSRPRRPTWP